MSKITWDATGDRLYETGVDRGVLYPINIEGKYTPGVAWNGLTGVTESPSGAEATALYADNIKYLSLYSAEEFGATIEAYTYPKEFESCDGSAELGEGVVIGQQTRKVFGLCYRTLVANDVDAQDHGYKLHLIYGCMASPSEKGYQSVNDSPEAITFSWEVTTTPVNVAGFKPTASLIIDSTKIKEDKLKKIEDILYGKTVAAYDNSKTYVVGDLVIESNKTYECTTEVSSPESFDSSKWKETTKDLARLPLPDEIKTILDAVG